MTTALEYLKANPVFHIATVDGTKARVRPFGFVMKRNGALYFCTNKTKDVYMQLSQNPEIEISDMGNDSTWLRIRGRIAFDDTRDAKTQAFKESARLLQIYPKGADDETFVTFYFTEAVATAGMAPTIRTGLDRRGWFRAVSFPLPK
ncbi:MAG: pyridoxamine 5'-phosphate oxidase family protein [Syntrophales bacterium LBB04]|nr:pyridoxamine 5'-phosphate oxidase family protein [Syntrophales bacterium LBB04]